MLRVGKHEGDFFTRKRKIKDYGGKWKAHMPKKKIKGQRET